MLGLLQNAKYGTPEMTTARVAGDTADVSILDSRTRNWTIVMNHFFPDDARGTHMYSEADDVRIVYASPWFESSTEVEETDVSHRGTHSVYAHLHLDATVSEV